MSDELAQDDEGFEVADFGVDVEEDEDVESSAAHRGDRTQPGQEGPRYDPPRAANTAKEMPRESLDGETIFAVGEDGERWSEDGGEEEGRKLVGEPAKDT